MERENMLKVKARERISLRCKGGAEKVWRETQRQKDGRQSQPEEAMKKSNLWKKVMERRKRKVSKK